MLLLKKAKMIICMDLSAGITLERFAQDQQLKLLDILLEFLTPDSRVVAGPTQSGGTNQIINYIVKPKIVDGKLKAVAVMSVNFHYIAQDLSVHNYFTSLADVLLLDQKQIIMRKKSTVYYDVPFFSEQEG